MWKLLYIEGEKKNNTQRAMISKLCSIVDSHTGILLSEKSCLFRACDTNDTLNTGRQNEDGICNRNAANQTKRIDIYAREHEIKHTHKHIFDKLNERL